MFTILSQFIKAEVVRVRMLISPEQMLAAEKRYFEESGVPSIDVMERAARSLADEALARWPMAQRIFIACGPGGNGGDGYACARLLHEVGKKCEIYASAPARSADAVENRRRAAALGIPIYEETLPQDAPELWIDCIYGTGLSRAPEGRAAALIEAMTGAPVLAADIPSGLNGASGAAYSPCVCAEATVSFHLAKRGHFLQDGLDVCGELIVSDVGFPKEGFEGDAFLAEAEDLRSLLPPRKRNIHKGSCGHVLIVAGSLGMAGAAALCARSALRGGAGLVSICCPREILPILQTLAPCAMCLPLNAESLRAALAGKSAAVIGPGLGRAFDAELLRIVLESGLPAVVDADALNLLSENASLRALLRENHVLTPHPGEAARLLGRSCADPIADARELARTGATVILKGASRVISDGRQCHVSADGACGMARGGSGDVFAGLLGALLADPRRKNTLESCIAACELHGLAGALAQEKYGAYAMNSADILELLPEVFKRYAQ